MNKDSGLLLIDMLMAVAIVGIAAVATLEILTASVQAGRNTQDMQTATCLCRERLEQIRNIPALTAGTGSNAGDPFLPDMNDVSADEYFPGFFITESDTYQASDGTAGSLTGTTLSDRVDRVTRIEWVDDAGGGGLQDYFKVTVIVFWRRGAETRSMSLETIVTAG